jgi:hypothetical protein
MKPTIGTFLLGALVGAAIALGVRAAILDHDSGKGHDHSGMQMKEQPEPSSPSEPVAKGFLIDLGNENCPIMGRPVNGKTWSEWNGLRIGHCCPPCRKDFAADPEKALDEAGIDWRKAAEMVKAVKAASGPERERLLEEAKEQFTVVRMPEGSE